MLLWTDHVTEKHFPQIEKLMEKGFDGIEIPIGLKNPDMYKRLGSYLNNMGLGLTAVTSLSPEENVSSVDVSIRNAGLERLKWVIEMAQIAGAELICGPFHSAFASCLPLLHPLACCFVFPWLDASQ